MASPISFYSRSPTSATAASGGSAASGGALSHFIHPFSASSETSLHSRDVGYGFESDDSEGDPYFSSLSQLFINVTLERAEYYSSPAYATTPYAAGVPSSVRSRIPSDKELIDRFFCPRVSSCIQEATADESLPRLSEKEIIIAGRVLTDGLGDYFNMLSIISEINEKYPGQKIRLVIHLEEEYLEKIRSRLHCPPNVTLEVMTYPSLSRICDLKMNRMINNEGFYLQLPRKLQTAIEDAYFTLEYHTCDTQPYILPTPTMKIAEAGFGASKLSTETGLGICIRSERDTTARPLSGLSNPWLNNYLAREYNPATHSLGFAYFSNRSTSYTRRGLELTPESILYDYVLLCATQSTQDSIIIISNVTSLSNYNEQLAKALSPMGFSEIVMSSPSPIVSRIPLSHDDRHKRKIYIINPFPLSHEDFLTVRHNTTSPFVGCTGDQSLYEVIQDGSHIPFYQILDHKISFWDDLISFAEKKIGKSHPYTQYLTLLKNRNPYAGTDAKLSLHATRPGHSLWSDPYRDHVQMLTLIRSSDFLEGMRTVHAAIMAEKSASKNILLRIEGMSGAAGAGAGSAVTISAAASGVSSAAALAPVGADSPASMHDTTACVSSSTASEAPSSALASLTTNTLFWALHDKNVAHSANVRGKVNLEYNRLLRERGLDSCLIPGGDDLEALGINNTCPIAQPELYYAALESVLLEYGDRLLLA